MSDPPGTQWLKEHARRRREPRRQNAEDMFTPGQNYARNRRWAKPGPYWTKLNPAQEQQFRAWVQQHKINFDPDEAQPDYDMRGFWLALQNGDPRAVSQINKNDNRVHYNDYWKTPYDATFSAQSQWALPGAPDWKGDKLTMPNGRVIYDQQAGRWYGTREEPGG